VSCKAKSRPALAKTTPVIPPIVNKKINPIAKSIGTVNSITEPAIVAIQEKILTPVGTAIIKVADVKYALVSKSKPIVYMWWAQTINPKKQ